MEQRGSSPRMRGTHRRAAGPVGELGIIPAYAGNTRLTCFLLSVWRDHPRVCGEHRHESPLKLLALGSSPRMRGTQGRRTRHTDGQGIIPAYAGNTARSRCRCRTARDHPRVCGEHPFPEYSGLCSTGSSPRMRGTPVTDYQGATYHGIIPAYAGNTTVNEH